MKITHEAQFGFSRVFKLNFMEKEIYTPMFFPAVSSVDIKEFESIFNWIIEKKPNTFLVSAYDIQSALIQNFPIKESILMLDSGGYELKHLGNKVSWSLDDYSNVIKKTNPDIVISLDHPDDKNPIKNYNLLNEILDDDIFLEYTISETNHSRIPKVLELTLQEIQPNAIAIPERNLGISFIDRINTVSEISDILQKMENPILFHILGCSDPDSILRYANEGVDLFDGLGWYKRAVQYTEIKNGKFEMYADWSFIDSSKLSNCNCFVCKKANKIDHFDRVLSHNILAYSKLCEELQMQTIEGGSM